MKKLLALVLAAALILALSVTAFAATITTNGGTDSAPVYATYVSGGEEKIIYSVDISWGDMTFTYTDASAGDWDGSSHTYTNETEAAWTASASGADEITVKNHSNAAITAALTYTPGDDYKDVTGTFDNPTLNLATAVGTEVAAAPSGTAALTLSGALDDSVSEKTQVGSVVVTITAAGAATE
ncbi:MAG: hypothetical protein LUC89_05105 [Oscillospiraceae bacterium]|nr:hypothetical protein [Oscillospiraceae bacterium]